MDLEDLVDLEDGTTLPEITNRNDENGPIGPFSFNYNKGLKYKDYERSLKNPVGFNPYQI